MLEKTKAKSRKKLIGIVTAVDSETTIRVKVERKMTHPLYKKIIKSHKSYLVSYADQKIEVGDQVMIEECRPISKTKHFSLLKKIK